jgi:hypothetical protein
LEIFFFFLNNENKKQIHAYIQTDRNLFRQRKNAQKNFDIQINMLVKWRYISN